MEFNSARARVAPPVLEVLIARAVQLVPLQGNKACQSVSAYALTEQGFRDWMGSIHPVFAQMRLADILVEEGYDRMDASWSAAFVNISPRKNRR